jgi:two-component system response regulator TtrR
MKRSGQSGTVYVVDDSPPSCEALTALLESEHFEVKAFTDGQAFLKAIEPGMCQCVVLDFSMPGLDGHAVQRHLIGRGLSIPIIILSAHLTVPIAVKSMTLGATTVIEKSQNVDELLAAIRSAVNCKPVTAPASAETSNQIYASVEDRWGAKVVEFGLTKRQSEIAKLICESMSNGEMAQRLKIALDTVKMHVRKLYERLGVNDRVGVVRIMLGEDVRPSDNDR